MMEEAMTHCWVMTVQGVHKVFRQFKKFIDITTDVGNV